MGRNQRLEKLYEAIGEYLEAEKVYWPIAGDYGHRREEDFYAALKRLNEATDNLRKAHAAVEGKHG